jgi:hypothetical protein
MASDLCAAVALIWVSGVVLIASVDHLRDLIRRHRLVTGRREPRLVR